MQHAGTGLKLSGPGEWLVEKHGSKKRRSWGKFHVWVDASTSQIAAVEVTPPDGDDASQVGPLLDQVTVAVEALVGDGAYDRTEVYEAMAARHPDAAVIALPRVDAVLSATAATAPTQRDRHIQGIAQAGRMAWQQTSGYNERTSSVVTPFAKILCPCKKGPFQPLSIEIKVPDVECSRITIMYRTSNITNHRQCHEARVPGIACSDLADLTMRDIVTVMYLTGFMGLSLSEALQRTELYYAVPCGGITICDSLLKKWHSEARDANKFIDRRLDDLVYEARIFFFGEEWIVFSAMPVRICSLNAGAETIPRKR